MKTYILLNDESGYVLVITMIILVLLTIMGVTASNMTEIELKTAGIDRVNKNTFYTAESGIEVGRAVLNSLKAQDVGYWDLLLTNDEFTWENTTVRSCNLDSDPPCSPTSDNNDMVIDAVIDALGSSSRNVGEATFSLQIRDNDDLDGNLTVDTDNTIILTSTGNYAGGRTIIEVEILYNGDQYSQEHYDAESSNQAGKGDLDIQNNQRW